MGQSSSQLQEPTQQLPSDVEDTIMTMDRPGTAGTTGSQALARDLEKSIMDSSQDVLSETVKKKRKKKRQPAEQDSSIPNTQEATTPRTTNSSPLAESMTASIEAARRKTPNSKKWNDSDDPFEIARRDLQKWFKRKQMQEAVLENRARWVQMPNNKWGIKFYKPGEAPEKELTETDAANLRLIKFEMEKYRQTMEAAKEREKDEQGGATQKVDEDNAKPAKKKRNKSGLSKEEGVGDAVEDTANVENASVPAKAVENEEPTESKRAKKRKRKALEEAQEPVAEVQDEEARQKKKKKKKKQKTQDDLVEEPENRRPMRESARKAELLQQGLQANAENVAAWLASQDDPEAPPESNVLDPVQEAGLEVKSNKRKRKSQYAKDDEEDYQPPKQTTESTAPTASAPTSAPTASSGPFTAEEKKICDIVFGQVRKLVQEKIGLSDAELKAQIQKWRTAGYFKAELEGALPNRSKDQIRKFAQRRYHPYERGAWTADQDEALRDAHARWPDQWTKICELVDRSAGDCKDRWTKHLQFGDNKATGPWSQKEETKLLEAVEECVEAIKKEKSQDEAMLSDRERLESAINWRVVSDKVAGGRSSKRCREKYEKLKARQQRGDPVVASEQESTSEPTNDAAKEDRKEKQAKAALKGFEIGDYYDVFVEVHSAFKDHSAQFHDEKNVLWSIISTKNPASRFNMAWYGSTLRRVAIETALSEWPINSKKIKRKIEAAETIPAKALQLAKLVEKRCSDDTASLPRTFKPELIGKTAAELVAMKMASKKPRPVKEKGDLSKEIVSDSEPEEEEDEIQQSPATVKRQLRSPKKEPASSDGNEEQEVPESSEDELVSPENDIRREPSQPPETDEQDEAAESDGSVYENNEDPNEDDASDDNAAQPQPEPETEKPEPKPFRRPRVPKHEDDIPVSSINSRVGMDSAQASPSLSPEAFLQRCRTAGKKQHEEYVTKKSGGSSKRKR